MVSSDEEQKDAGEEDIDWNEKYSKWEEMTANKNKNNTGKKHV